MCAYSSENAGVEKDLSSCGFEANCFKTLTTDMMQEAAQSLVQLVGAKAYRYSHIGGRGIIDSRPFQIFEGSNDILYAQISESFVKLMKQAKEDNLYQFLKKFRFAILASTTIKDLLNFDLKEQLTQRKMIELGKMLSFVVAMNMVVAMGKKGFRQDLIQNAITILQTEISGIMGHFKQINNTMVLEDYKNDSLWNNYI